MPMSMMPFADNATCHLRLCSHAMLLSIDAKRRARASASTCKRVIDAVLGAFVEGEGKGKGFRVLLEGH